MSNHYLREAWQRKAENERGYDSDSERPIGYDRDVKTFINIEQIITNLDLSKKDEKLSDVVTFYRNVLDSVLKYNVAILNYNQAKSDKIKNNIDKEEMEEKDRFRRNVHEALISNINILSRLMKGSGLDNSWRNDIGISRQEVQRWAQNVALYLQER